MKIEELLALLSQFGKYMLLKCISFLLKVAEGGTDEDAECFT